MRALFLFVLILGFLQSSALKAEELDQQIEVLYYQFLSSRFLVELNAAVVDRLAQCVQAEISDARLDQPLDRLELNLKSQLSLQADSCGEILARFRERLKMRFGWLARDLALQAQVPANPGSVTEMMGESTVPYRVNPAPVQVATNLLPSSGRSLALPLSVGPDDIPGDCFEATKSGSYLQVYNCSSVRFCRNYVKDENFVRRLNGLANLWSFFSNLATSNESLRELNRPLLEKKLGPEEALFCAFVLNHAGSQALIQKAAPDSGIQVALKEAAAEYYSWVSGRRKAWQDQFLKSVSSNLANMPVLNLVTQAEPSGQELLGALRTVSVNARAETTKVEDDARLEQLDLERFFNGMPRKMGIDEKIALRGRLLKYLKYEFAKGLAKSLWEGKHLETREIFERHRAFQTGDFPATSFLNQPSQFDEVYAHVMSTQKSRSSFFSAIKGIAISGAALGSVSACFFPMRFGLVATFEVLGLTSAGCLTAAALTVNGIFLFDSLMDYHESLQQTFSSLDGVFAMAKFNKLQQSQRTVYLTVATSFLGLSGKGAGELKNLLKASPSLP